MNLINSIPIGQYVDGDKSWLRFIDVRIKFLCVLVFLLSPILSGSIWRICLVISLLVITFASLLPIRVWIRSVVFLFFFSIIIGIFTLFISSGDMILDSSIRDPNELSISIQNNINWELIRLKFYLIQQSKPIIFIISQRSATLAIKTSTLLFTVIHSVNLMLLTTRQEDLMWAINYFLRPLENLGLPIKRYSFQLLLALRFIPLIQEELQNLIKSTSVRAISLRKLGFKGSLRIILALLEKLLNNILLRSDQGAEALLAKNIDFRINLFNPNISYTYKNYIANFLSFVFVILAFILRYKYGSY